MTTPAVTIPGQQPTEEEVRLTREFAQDRPTIDAAVKTFISLVCARSMTASATDQQLATSSNSNGATMMGIIDASSLSQTDDSSSGNTVRMKLPVSTTTTTTTQQQQVLQVARAILKTLNSYTFPIHDTVMSTMADNKPGLSEDRKKELVERSVVSRLWNALKESDQKPSRFLGKKALKVVWKNLDVVSNLLPSSNTVTVEEETALVHQQQLEWLQEFERLLFQTPLPNPQPPSNEIDDDSALIWGIDGGQEELSRRRQRRMDAAMERGGYSIVPS